MQLNTEILNELKAISPKLAEMDKVNVFSVPKGYFETFSSNLYDQLQFTESSKNIAKIDSPYSVPEGYFESLSANILSALKNTDKNAENDILEISEVLSGLNKTNPFTVPGNYFEDFPSQMLSKLPREAKVITMHRPAFLRYAVAAVITGIMGLSLFTIIDNKAAITSQPQYTAQVMKHASEIVQSNSFDKELDALSGKDIEQYLKKSGQNVEAALVASVTDETNLPSEEDYLFDENTLDTFLKTVNLNN